MLPSNCKSRECQEGKLPPFLPPYLSQREILGSRRIGHWVWRFSIKLDMWISGEVSSNHVCEFT